MWQASVMWPPRIRLHPSPTSAARTLYHMNVKQQSVVAVSWRHVALETDLAAKS